MIQRTVVILIMFCLILPDILSAQVGPVEPSDPSGSSYSFGYSTAGGGSWGLFKIDKFGSSRREVHTLPHGFTPVGGLVLDIVQHLLYATGRLSGTPVIFKIDPVANTFDTLPVPPMPGFPGFTCVEASLAVDASTGFLFLPCGVSSVLKLNPVTGSVVGIASVPDNSTFLVADQVNHILYAGKYKLDMQTMNVTEYGGLPDGMVPTFYDPYLNALIGAGWTTSGTDLIAKLNAYKLDLTTNKPQVVTVREVTNPQTMYPDPTADRVRLSYDELHHLLAVGSEGIIDVSGRELVRTTANYHFWATHPNNLDHLRVLDPGQVIVLDWTNSASGGWVVKTYADTRKKELVFHKTGSSVTPDTDKETFRKPIVEHVRKIFNGTPANERTHIHIPILEYTGPKRLDESRRHATYVRFPRVELPCVLGVAWETLPFQGCEFDQFNKRRSGEVAVFIDPTGKHGDSYSEPQRIAETVAHEVGHALGLRHVLSHTLGAHEVMDYDEVPLLVTEVFSGLAEKIFEPPTLKSLFNLEKDYLNFEFNNPLYHLRRYVLDERVDSPFLLGLRPGDWDINALKCTKVTVGSSSFAPLYNFSILGPRGGSNFDGVQTLAYFDSVSSLQGIEVVAGKGAPLKIVASSVPGGDWDLYFVPANDTSQLEIPGSALTPGPFAGKIMKYSPLTTTFSEVGTFSMNITEFQTDPPPGPPLPPNNPPVANAGPDQTVPLPSGLPTASVTLNGAGSSDPDGDTLDFFWSGPFGISGGLQPTVSLPAGSHEVTLAVNDGKGKSSSDTVTINVVASISLRGDFDGDRDVDLNDWKILARDLNKTVQNSACGAKCDLDSDGRITLRDVLQLVQICTRPFCRTEKYKENLTKEDGEYKDFLKRLR